jgi:hypothetical protein
VIERHDPRPDLQLARISYDILGLIPLREGAVSVRTLRPGRTIELVEAVLEIAGRTVVRATAWRLSRQETLGVQGGYPARLPDPDAMIAWPIDALWDGGYIASLTVRKPDDEEPGQGQAWVRSDVELVAGEDARPSSSFLRLVDTATASPPG